MRDFFRPLTEHPFVRSTHQWLRKSWAPVLGVWEKITDFLHPYTAPIVGTWKKWTAPARLWWEGFKSRRPRTGSVLAFFGKAFRYGFNLLLFLLFGVLIGLFGHIPSRQELREVETANATEIYTVDSVLIGKFYIENRTSVTLENISPHIINALIATEDRRFLEHSGIDIKSWFRVAFGMVVGKEAAGGGSTLSQQLAKNLYPRRNYYLPGISLIINKLRENYISIKLERVYSKQQLLHLYLNTVPFGGDIFGVQVASRQYFNKKPKELSVDQAAALVGMLKATTFYNPVRNPENARKRRNVVLLQMVRNGHLSQEEYRNLSQKPVGARRYSIDSNNTGTGTYFREYLRTAVMPGLLQNLQKEDGSKYNLYKDGLRIYTPIHSKMQQYAEEAVVKHMADLQKQFDQHWKNFKQEKPWGDDRWIGEQIRRSTRWQIMKEAGVPEAEAIRVFERPVKMTIFTWKNGGAETDTLLAPIDSVRYYFCLLNCGFMAMDHHNGQIRAWVGGTNFKHFKFDHILSRRQVGSTFKPIVYAAAIAQDISPCTYIPNEITKLAEWEPHNADEIYGGYYSLTGALTRSVNVVAAQLIDRVGIQYTIDLAKKMGVTTHLPREYGISLGAADITLYDMMKVYGTLANKGIRPEPVAVLKVTDRRGKVLYDYDAAVRENYKIGPNGRALTEKQAAVMTQMLENVINQGTGSRLRRGYGISGDFAGKTGTTQNQADGWFICYNPTLVTGAWVGAPSPAVRFRSLALGQGSSMALPIVAWFWHKVANDRKLSKLVLERFPDPKPEERETWPELDCYHWIGIPQDSFELLMADSTRRDSIVARYTKGPTRDSLPDAPEKELPKPGPDKAPAARKQDD